MVEKNLFYLREYLNCHKQDVCRNMGVKVTAGEISRESEENVEEIYINLENT